MAELKRATFGLNAEQREAIERRVVGNEACPQFAARERAREAEKQAEELANLESMTEKALNGTYGAFSKKIASDWVASSGRSRWAMEQLRAKLSRVPGRQSG